WRLAFEDLVSGISSLGNSHTIGGSAEGHTGVVKTLHPRARVPKMARDTIPLMPTKVTVSHNGPIRLEGEFEILDPAGATFGLAGPTIISLRRCGQSANKPFCDGSHARTGFNHQVEARELPPPKPKL